MQGNGSGVKAVLHPDQVLHERGQVAHGHAGVTNNQQLWQLLAKVFVSVQLCESCLSLASWA
jgi:hypothetical protein